MAKLQAGEITNMFLCRRPRFAASYDIETSGRSTPIEGLLIAGSLVAPELALTAYEMFGGNLYQLYGASECGPVTAIGPQEWFAKVEGSDPVAFAGRPLPWVEVHIRDVDTGNILPIGKIGEIVCRSEAQAAGFLDNVDEASVFLDNGWVCSSDIGRLDENGFLYVLDRKDDSIISGGFNIWPAEIENLLGSDEFGSYKKPTRVALTTDDPPKTDVARLIDEQCRASGRPSTRLV